MLDSGTLNKRVAIQEKSATQTDSGAETVTWTTIATVWASIQPLQGRERWAAQQTNAEISHRVRMRHRTLISENRLLYGTRVFDIESVINPREYGEELEVMCVEQV